MAYLGGTSQPQNKKQVKGTILGERKPQIKRLEYHVLHGALGCR